MIGFYQNVYCSCFTDGSLKFKWQFDNILFPGLRILHHMGGERIISAKNAGWGCLLNTRL